MTKQTETKGPGNIKQEPYVDALAEIVARLIRAQEQGVKLRKEAEAE